MSILRGVWRLARFQADGFAEFAANAQALLNSLAPLMALPLVGGLFELVRGDVASALRVFLLTLVALLTPLVVSEAFARRWGRSELWLRYAVASTWCQWAPQLALLGLLVVLSLLQQAGSPAPDQVLTLIIGAYSLALHWFLARRGLNLSRLRALLLVIVADVLTGALVIGPLLIDSAP